MCKQRQGIEPGTNTQWGTNVQPKCGGNCKSCPIQQKIITETIQILEGIYEIQILF